MAGSDYPMDTKFLTLLLIVVNQIKLSPEKEMVDDMFAIVHTFSCRLYGMRKYEKNLKEDYPDATKTTVELD